MLNAKGVSSFNDKMDTHHEQWKVVKRSNHSSSINAMYWQFFYTKRRITTPLLVIFTIYETWPSKRNQFAFKTATLEG